MHQTLKFESYTVVVRYNHQCPGRKAQHSQEICNDGFGDVTNPKDKFSNTCGYHSFCFIRSRITKDIYIRIDEIITADFVKSDVLLMTVRINWAIMLENS